MGETLFADHSDILQSFVENISNVECRALYLLPSVILKAWELLPYLAPGQLGKRALKAGAPLIGRWNDVFHSPNLATHLIGTYRYHLDMQRPDKVRLDTRDLHIHLQHKAEVELDFMSNNDGEDDEVEEEADLQDPILGGDPEGGGEVT
ncbi:hypothetical protein RHMOL_Rhmol09G0086300 [Rhododendron molle]|uniref:Uncharacterized protein n=1 Tax=Rhododendron molle TaxID=49168 RepID=A0ACC0MB20_RHOML|nr:hypothetical protein RHMOL_Rhmol09G0086300 [Rhododendron molle]